jgi:hypothetical protein
VRVTWVHPTWRDLVIDAVSRDAEARLHFVRHCGAHGAVLALSTSGGAGGRRGLPLLGSDRDWDALADRLYALAPELETTELLVILSALSHALDTFVGDDGGSDEARELARVVLARVASVWASGRGPIELSALDSWLALSRRLSPVVAPPPLAPTWAALEPILAPDPADRVAVARLTDWLELWRMLADFDERLAPALGVSEQHLLLLAAFLEAVEHASDGAGEGGCEHLRPALTAVEAVAPQLGGHARTLLAKLPATASGPPPPGVVLGWLQEREPEPSGFDVGRVLVDL